MISIVLNKIMVESASSAGPVQSKPMVNKFSKNILKTVVGAERANNVFQSMSMGTIPKSTSFSGGVGKTMSAGIF